ncbi:GNAT family N-acetyltransferase [Radiobacillus sp. PE A8.2]|uniref:GNAT family N-acetyltransferase n=1 Tax=Radiobacillus sp. PE A8.2 TaxID=3380349 RepID=UPI003890F8A6
MKVNKSEFHIKGLHFAVRSALEKDAEQLSTVRWKIDGETENLDRVQGEAYIDEAGFKQLIYEDTESARNLFLVAEVNERIVGFSRCEGSELQRFTHKVEFGVCVLKEYWGYGIGENLLQQSLDWADAVVVKKVTLKVLETNQKAINLYKKYGFEVEGILKKDKILSDGKYYNTIMMGRFHG